MFPEPYSWDRATARHGTLDGRFIIGVLTTGIYCLPSCAARPAKPENVRLFGTETEARAAGLRACKRCRPDLYYRGEDSELALFEGLRARLRAAPERFTGVAALARSAGVSLAKLEDLLRRHAHLTPAAWLRRERVLAACRQLLETTDRVVEIGHAVGFASESAFHRQFLALTRMTPGAYRGLDGARVFQLQLPAGYRADEVLAYHGRDRAGLGEVVRGRRIGKALATTAGAAVLEISVERAAAWCTLHSAGALDRTEMREIHATALRMLGLTTEVGAFETRARRDARMSALVARRPGLRLPLSPTPFEGLVWAIIGQQINVAFATALRRALLDLAGTPVGELRAHPTPEQLAALEPADLTRLRFSRAKADYLIGTARAVAAGDLAIDTLADGSAVVAERDLKRLHGVGTWTARYAMMRGVGFADCTPVGDVALAAALQRFAQADARPDVADVEALMQPFAPHRSLATCHLWASLKDAA